MKIIQVIGLTLLLLFSSGTFADRSPMDEDVIASIQSEIALDEDLSNVFITVTCQDGFVNLIGEVGTNAQLTKVVDIAQATYGVYQVDASHLVVNPY